MARTLQLLAFAVAGALAASACGSSGSSSTTSEAGGATPAVTPSSPTPGPGTAPATASGLGALVGEAGSAAAGDIPDNQNFLLFQDRSRRFSMRYPEGWAIQRTARSITFRDKN